MAEFSTKLTHPLSYTFASEAIISNCKSTTAKKILITGASGYVGQHLIASLVSGGISISGGSTTDDEQQQYKVYCAYNSLSTFEADLNGVLQSSTLHPSIEGIYPIPNVDFSQSGYIDIIQQAVCGSEGDQQTKLDAIIHLAALSSPGYCEKNQEEAMKVNLPLDLLKIGAPIIYMSTDQVYEGTKQYYKEDIDEANPVNVYGKSKLEYEKVLLGKNVPGSTILRSSLILGPPTPFQHGCKKGAYPSFLQFIESRLQSSTPTDYFVNEFRSVVHINDVILAIKHFLQHALTVNDLSEEAKMTKVYNLGGSTRASRYELAMEVANHLKLDTSSVNGIDRPTTGGGVPSPPDISMNVDKITNELGLEQMMSLKEIVASTFK